MKLYLFCGTKNLTQLESNRFNMSVHLGRIFEIGPLTQIFWLNKAAANIRGCWIEFLAQFSNLFKIDIFNICFGLASGYNFCQSFFCITPNLDYFQVFMFHGFAGLLGGILHFDNRVDQFLSRFHFALFWHLKSITHLIFSSAQFLYLSLFQQKKYWWLLFSSSIPCHQFKIF